MSPKKQLRANFNAICLKRDHYRCVMCRTQTRPVVVHHITDRKAIVNGGYVKENGITLCGYCHWLAEKFHRTNGRLWNEHYHPDDLYDRIGSSHVKAFKASGKL